VRDRLGSEKVEFFVLGSEKVEFFFLGSE